MSSDDLDKDGSASATGEMRTEQSLEDAAQCARCGYALYGLADDQRCPECAFPVGASRQGPWLKFADPRWLRRLTIGAFIVMVTTTLLSLYQMVAPFFPAFTAHRFIALAMPVLFVLDLAGYWLLSEPNPRKVGEQITVTMRSALRFALFVSISLFIFSTFISDMLGIGVGYPFLRLLVIENLIAVITAFLRISVIGLISARIPDARCKTLANALRIGFIIPFAMLQAIGLLLFWQYLAMFAGGSVEIEIPLWCRPVAGFLTFIAWLFLTYLFIRFARLLRREYRVAVVSIYDLQPTSAGTP